MTAPLISVIIPALNAEKYLAEAIGSVLDQTYKPIEIIVVDDGSDDATAEVAARFNPYARYLYQNNAGAAAARNSGVKIALGDLLAFLDADDVWLDHKLSRQYEILTGSSEIEMVFGFVQQFISPDLTAEEAKTILIDTNPMPGYTFGTVLIKREAFLNVGYISEEWKAGEFIDWYLRAKDHGISEAILREVVMKRRIHTSNMMRGSRDLQQDYLRILKLDLDRRKAGRRGE